MTTSVGTQLAPPLVIQTSQTSGWKVTFGILSAILVIGLVILIIVWLSHKKASKKCNYYRKKSSKKIIGKLKTKKRDKKCSTAKANRG